MDVDARARALASAFAGIRPSSSQQPSTDAFGREACKTYLRRGACERVGCERAHVALGARASCDDFERYGLCPRLDECWYEHRAMPHEDVDACFACDGESAERLTTRLREMFGASSVKCGSRIELKRKADGVLCVSARGGAMRVIREMCEREPHGLGLVKRVFAWPDKERFATFETRNAKEMGDMERWIESMIDSLIADARATDEAPIYIRARATPKDFAEKLDAALASIYDRRGETLAARPPGKGVSSRQCTHCIDGVQVRGRAFVGLWETRRSYEERGEPARKSLHEPDAPSLPAPGEATMDDLVQFHLKLQDYRVAMKPVCRAFFKLHEALLRRDVPIAGDWNCVDIGAAPGGWVQVLTSRLAASKSEHSDGVVWAIDPAELKIDPMPAAVRHLRVLASDAVETVREGLKATSSGELRLVVCDANMHPAACTRIALNFATQFASTRESWLIVSLKNFCKRRSDWLEEIEAAKRQCLEAGYDDAFALHLFSNCAEEKTLFARRNGERKL